MNTVGGVTLNRHKFEKYSWISHFGIMVSVFDNENQKIFLVSTGIVLFLSVISNTLVK